MTPTDVPVLLMIFNRPEYTRRVFEAIRTARPARLYVSADGPRSPLEIAPCEETRLIIDNGVDWPCEVHKNYAPRNMGLRDRVSSGINWFFEHEEEGIILEDDCLPHQSFFSFAGEMLARYRNDDRVLMISGSNPTEDPIPESYLFSRYFNIWGWATWRRAWSHYDVTMRDWPARQQQHWLRSVYRDSFMRWHMNETFAEAYSRQHTWDTQWFYTCLTLGGLSVVPAKNLITNIGISGTHTAGSNQNRPSSDLYATGRLTHPAHVAVDDAFDSHLYALFYYQPWLAHITRSVKKRLYSVRIAKRAYRLLIKIKIYLLGQGAIHLPGSQDKRALIKYIVEPFKNKAPNYRHQNYQQVRELAAILQDLGYAVDVVNFADAHVRLSSAYDLVLDLHPGLGAPYTLAPGGKRIAYATGSNPEFSNKAERERIEAVMQRRKVVIRSRRQVPMFDPHVSSFDGALLMGNKVTQETWGPSLPHPTYLIPNTGYPEMARSVDFSSRSTKSFVFISGSGMLLKGLDLLLEIFPRHPEWHLYICGPYNKEPDFVAAYEKELHDTPNIHTVGIVDVTSFTFSDIANKCAYLVSPSSTEGMSGSVLAGMSVGLIPIVSKHSGFDADTAILLPDCEIHTVEQTLAEYTDRAPEWVEHGGYKALQAIEETYNTTRFKDMVRRDILAILSAS